MSNESPRGFEWPTRQWVTWGVIAIVVLVAAIVLINVMGGGTDTPEVPEGTDQMEWSIVLTDMTGLTVTLKGDEPFGFPTETWENDFLLERQVSNTFEWDLDADLPQAVVDIDESSDCADLNEHLLSWGGEVGQALGDARRRQAQAFTQHAINAMRDGGCEFDISSLDL